MMHQFMQQHMPMKLIVVMIQHDVVYKVGVQNGVKCFKLKVVL